MVNSTSGKVHESVWYGGGRERAGGDEVLVGRRLTSLVQGRGVRVALRWVPGKQRGALLWHSEISRSFRGPPLDSPAVRRHQDFKQDRFG